MPNERLRDALMSRGLTCAVIAERVEVDPKTVERWIASDRVPRRTHRCAVASLVGIDEGYLWPTALNASGYPRPGRGAGHAVPDPGRCSAGTVAGADQRGNDEHRRAHVRRPLPHRHRPRAGRSTRAS